MGAASVSIKQVILSSEIYFTKYLVGKLLMQNLKPIFARLILGQFMP